MHNHRHSTPGARAGKVRTALIALLVIVVLLVAFVALAPTLVSMGLGQGLVRSALQDQVEGDVDFDGLSLSWFGDQSVRGLEIVESGGRKAIDVDLRADRGLIHLVRGEFAPIELQISGQLDGAIEADGTLSFSKLLPGSDDAKEGGKDRSGADADRSRSEPTTLPDQGPVEVVLSETTLRLEDARSGRRMTFDDIDGRLTYNPGQATLLQLTSTTEASGLAGSVSVRAETLGLVDAQGRLAPSGAGMQVDVELKSVPVLYAEVDSVIDNLTVNVTSDDLTKQLVVGLDGQTRVEDAAPSQLVGNVVIDQPFNAAGEPTIEFERISGTLSGNSVPSGLLAPILAAAGLGATVDPLRDLGPTLDIQAAATSGDEGLLTATVDAERLQARVAARETPEGMAVDTATVTGVLSPGLLSGLQPDEPQPIEVAAATPFTLNVEPFVIPGGRSRGFEAPAKPVRARLQCAEAVLQHVPGLVAALGISSLDTTVSMSPGAESAAGWGVTAKALLLAGTQQLGTLDADLTSGAGEAALTGRVNLSDAPVGQWERLLGYERGALRKWLGGRMSVEIGLQEQAGGYRATVRPQSPTIDGTLVASVTDEMIDLQSQGAAFTVRRSVLADMLSGRPAGGSADDSDEATDTSSDETRRVRVPKALRLQLAIDECRLPLELLRGEPVDPAAVRLAVRLTGGPLELIYPDRTTAALRDIDLALNTENLRDGLRLRLDAKSAAGQRQSEGEQAGTVAITGRLAGMLDDTGALALDDAIIELDATLEGLPTAIVDAMANFDGLLVDAVGANADARIVARDFSGTSGTLDATINTTHGSLQASVAGVDGTLQSIEGKGNEARLELTPEFRQRLLTRIHPIFADVRTVESPLQLSADSFVLPLDGEPSRLSADLNLAVGAVELDSGSVLLGLLTLFDQNPKSTIAGFIEPIRASIRDGVVRYDRFAVKLDKYTLAYTGQIDLNSGQLDLRTEIPLSALATSINELDGYADKITVPLVTRGSLEQPKTEIDPQFNLGEQAAAAGFQGVLDELGKQVGDDRLGGILGNILGGGKKKETDPPK